MSAVELRPRNNESATPISLSLGQQVTLGNSIIADYSFPQMGMDDIHCRISALRHGCFVECFSANGTVEINGTPVNRIRLKSGDSVALGNLEFVVSVAKPPTKPPTDLREAAEPAQIAAPVKPAAVPDDLPKAEDKKAVEAATEAPSVETGKMAVPDSTSPEIVSESRPTDSIAAADSLSESPLGDQAADDLADPSFSASTALNGTVWKHEIPLPRWAQEKFQFADEISCFAIKINLSGLELQRIDQPDPDSFGGEVFCLSRQNEQDIKEQLYSWIQYLKTPTLFDRFIGMAPKNICQRLFDTMDAFLIVDTKNQAKNLRLLTLCSPDELSKIVTQKADSA